MSAAGLLLCVTLALSGCDGQWTWLWAKRSPADPPSTPTTGANVFKGTVQAEWLPPSTTGDTFRDMRLLAPFGYIDARGTHWDVPAGYITNGASVPWGLWNIVGGPFDGPYRDAAVIHDYFCDKKDRPWEDVHKMFYEAAIARGTRESVAATMYAGLRFGGPRWQLATPVAPTPAPAPAVGKPLAMGQALAGHLILAQAKPGTIEPGLTARPATALEKQQFEELQQWIAREKPSIAEIEKRVEELRRLQGKSTTPTR
jgi:hypothetical protein